MAIDETGAMLKLCKQQGYVPQGCSVDGFFIMACVNENKNPCDDCNVECKDKPPTVVKKNATFQCDLCLMIKPIEERSLVKYGDGRSTCKKCEREIETEQKRYRNRPDMKGLGPHVDYA